MSQSETIHNMAISHECSNCCRGDCLGLSALARAREDSFFALRDELLIAELKTQFGSCKGKNNSSPQAQD